MNGSSSFTGSARSKSFGETRSSKGNWKVDLTGGCSSPAGKLSKGFPPP